MAAPPPPIDLLLFQHNNSTHTTTYTPTTLPIAAFLIAATTLLLLLLRRLLSASSSIFIVDFCCYKPEDDQLKCNFESLEYSTRVNAHRFTLASMDFLRKIFERSGLGEETYLPPCFRHNPDGVPSSEDARAEAEDVMFTAVRQLLQTTGVDASQISVLVTNCSLHWPTPSYASMIVNRFKLPEDCKTFHLAGMGCSASVIACKLAADVLRVSSSEKRRKYALVVSTENISNNYYYGNNKPMLVTNCLFRVGGAAVLLARDYRMRRRGYKYQILHAMRTHECSDEAYKCAYQREDEEGKVGISLDKNLMRVAAETLRKSIRRLAPLILPAAEVARYVYGVAVREEAVPDFSRGVDHFCIHSGGRAVIDAVQRRLGLADSSVEPSRATLHRWGNTSSSSLWYMLAYLECKGRMKAGNKVWMLGLGAGFKCNSAILLALSDINSAAGFHPLLHNPWNDCIHRYPSCLLANIHTLPSPPPPPPN